MKFSICNELYFDRDFESACEHARAAGYQGIEIAPFTLGTSVFEISNQYRKEVAEIARRHDLQIVGLHWLLAKTQGLHLTEGDQDVYRRTLSYLRGLIELCSDLGGKVMVFGSPQQRSLSLATSYQTGFSFAKSLFQELAPVLESNDVKLALEPLDPAETNFLTTAESTVELIQAIGSSQIGLILDVKAMTTEAVPIPAVIHRHAAHLIHFHANDPNRQGPGMGEVRFEPIMQALHDIGYQDWVSVEVFDYSPGVDALATKSIQTLNACVRT
jgi:sugar phosphate isomerase/epimerase